MVRRLPARLVTDDGVEPTPISLDVDDGVGRGLGGRPVGRPQGRRPPLHRRIVAQEVDRLRLDGDRGAGIRLERGGEALGDRLAALDDRAVVGDDLGILGEQGGQGRGVPGVVCFGELPDEPA